MTSSYSIIKKIPQEKSSQYSLHDPDAVGETMTAVRFFDNPMQSILAYLDQDIHPIQDIGETKSYMKQYAEFKLLGKNLGVMMEKELTQMANQILRGEEIDIQAMLSLIKTRPILLHIETHGFDLLGRKVTGTLLQIAAKAGDVNLRDVISNDHDKGIVERLIKAGKLSYDEVKEQLQCITSDEAKIANQQRNSQILNAIEKFGKYIIETKPDENMDFKAYQQHFKDQIAELDNTLRVAQQEPIDLGYVFDLKILCDALQWYKSNMNSTDCSASVLREIFLVTVLGKLQNNLSSRDAHVMRAGLGVWMCGEGTPSRILNNQNGMPHLFDPYTRLGTDYYIGYQGLGTRYSIAQEFIVPKLENLCRAKERALEQIGAPTLQAKISR